MKVFQMAWVLAMLLCLPLGAGAAILARDNFSDGDRTNQSLPNSLEWFNGQDGADMSVVSQQLQIRNMDAGSEGGMAYFTDSGTPFELTSGNGIRLSFDILIDHPGDDYGRFQTWFYNSGGTRISADNTGFNNNAFNGYAGYGVQDDPNGSHPIRYATSERAGGLNNLIFGSSDVSSRTPAVDMTSATLIPVSLTLERSGDSVTVTGNINGQEVSGTDSSGIYTQFDTIAILSVNDSSALTFTIDNVLVESFSTVPEPRSLSLICLGGLALVAGLSKKP